MGSISQEFSGDTTKLERAYEKLHRENAKLMNEQQKLADESKKNHSAALAIGDRVVSQLSSMAAGYLGVQGAIAAVNRSLEEKKRLGQEALTTQLALVQAEMDALTNLGGVPTARANAFIESIKDIAHKAGYPSSAPVIAAASNVLSAVGGDEDVTLKSLRASAPFSRQHPEQLGQLASRTSDVERQLQFGDYDRTAATMISVQQQARIETLEQMKNFVPAAGAVIQNDTSGDRFQAFREGAALFSTIGKFTSDAEGAESGTFTASYAAKLRQIYPDKDIIGPDGKVVRPGTGLKTLLERHLRIQDDVHGQRLFLQGGEGVDKGGFRATKDAFAEALITKGSDISRDFVSTISKITANTAEAEQVAENLKSATPELQLAAVGSRVKANREKFDLSKEGGRRAQLRDWMVQDLPRLRSLSLVDNILGGAYDYADLLRFDTAKDPYASAEAAYESSERILRAGKSDSQLDSATLEQIQLARDTLQAIRELRDMGRQPSKAQGQVGVGREN